jgi:hypothetical protein
VAQRGREQIEQYIVPYKGETEEAFQIRRLETTRRLQSLRPFGIGDNATNYTRWLDVAPIYKKLIFENLAIPPFMGSNITDGRAPAAIYLYSIGRAMQLKTDLTEVPFVLGCAEYLLPKINTTLLASQRESRQIVVEAVKNLLPNRRRLNQELRNYESAWTNAITENPQTHTIPLAALWEDDETRNPFNAHHPVPENLNMPIERLNTITPEEAVVYLMFLASHYINKELPLAMLTSTYVACAKQGQITPTFITKVTEGVETDLGHTIELNLHTIRILYNQFGNNFDDITAPVVFRRWEQMFPDQALRLRLTVEQVTFNRLTVYLVIKEALQTFPSFPWPRLNKLLPGELERYCIAVNLIGNNPYFRYKKDIGEAVSTRYKNLGWVAKELLIRGAGKSSLVGYVGWPRTVPNHDRVKRIIDTFLRHLGETDVVAQADMDAAHSILE